MKDIVEFLFGWLKKDNNKWSEYLLVNDNETRELEGSSKTAREAVRFDSRAEVDEWVDYNLSRCELEGGDYAVYKLDKLSKKNNG